MADLAGASKIAMGAVQAGVKRIMLVANLAGASKTVVRAGVNRMVVVVVLPGVSRTILVVDRVGASKTVVGVVQAGVNKMVVVAVILPGVSRTILVVDQAGASRMMLVEDLAGESKMVVGVVQAGVNRMVMVAVLQCGISRTMVVLDRAGIGRVMVVLNLGMNIVVVVVGLVEEGEEGDSEEVETNQVEEEGRLMEISHLAGKQAIKKTLGRATKVVDQTGKKGGERIQTIASHPVRPLVVVPETGLAGILTQRKKPLKNQETKANQLGEPVTIRRILITTMTVGTRSLTMMSERVEKLIMHGAAKQMQ